MARLDDLEEANGRLELIRTLADTEEIIRFHPDILEDDIRAYANNSPFRSKFEKPSRGVKSIFFDHTKRNYLELDKVAAGTKIMIAAYGNQMDVIFKKAHPQADADKKANKQQPFEDSWKAMAPPWAEQVADSFGVLDKVKARGVKGLLKVHSFRLLTTAQLSLAYSHIYERRRFRQANSRDMHHVACAAAVPIFVTHDKPLTSVLNRKPINGFTVMDLPQLLSRV